VARRVDGGTRREGDAVRLIDGGEDEVIVPAAAAKSGKQTGAI
jgi:hypothetical protein